MTRSRMTVRRGAVLTLATLALAGCSTSTDAEAAHEVSVGHLTLTVPGGWVEEEAAGPWDKKFVGDDLQLQVAGTFSDDPTASAARARLDLPATLELSGYESRGVHEPDVEVEGADTSVRSDFVYTDDGEQMEGTWVIAGQWPYPSTAAISITGASVEGDVVESIIDSLEFDKTAGETP